MNELTRFDLHCPACGYDETAQQKPVSQCPECGQSLHVEKCKLHELSVLDGRRVRFRSFSYAGVDLEGLIGTVVDTDGPGGVIWVHLDQELPQLSDAGNEVIIDQHDSADAGHTGLVAFFSSIAEAL